MGSTGRGTEATAEASATTGHPAPADAGMPTDAPAEALAEPPAKASPPLDRIDAMTRHAIERLLDSPDGWRPLARDLVARWPASPALELIFAIVSAAEAIETMFGPGSPALAGAEAGYKVAALLSVDLFAMQSVSLPHQTAADFAAYWQSDPWFRLI